MRIPHIRRHWLIVFLLIMVAVAMITIASQIPVGDLELEPLERWLHSYGVWFGLAFILCAALLMTLPIPSTIWVLIGGGLFGPWLGTVLNLLAMTASATLAFLLGRYWARAWIQRQSSRQLACLLRGVEQEEWRFVAMTRLIPIFPFAPTNFALGVTGLRLHRYVITTGIALIPNTLGYTWLGYATRQALAGAEQFVQWLMGGIALLAVIVFLPRLLRRMLHCPKTE